MVVAAAAVAVVIAAATVGAGLVVDRSNRRPAPVPPAVVPSLGVSGGAQWVDRPRLTGQRGPGPPGLRLLVGGAAPAVIDARTGARTPLLALPVDDNHFARLLLVGNEVLALVHHKSGAPASIFNLNLTRPARFLGRADGAAAIRRGIVTATRTEDASLVQAMTLGGTVSWSRRIAGTVEVYGETRAGVLVLRVPSPARTPRGELRLLDPATGADRRPLATALRVVAVGSRLVAFLGGDCAMRCPLYLADVSNGRRWIVPTPDQRVPLSGAFSPDERRLALSFYGLHEFESRPRREGFVAVLDVESARYTRVPGVATPSKQAADVAWSADGRYLTVGVKWPDHEHFAVWPAAGGELTVLTAVLPAPSSRVDLHVLSGWWASPAR